ncbi:MFS transporter [Gordonia sp. (in: high G+C Gram-positive bacteria)]|uniref:MFS transporter n=1 Tax=Gordonia sp. (in: high G+C Gram-positive bacteria) TaxID=84139 RepID=UPI001D760685|nr:MFS transporter [Gordonia sp. (in: high G+C Gram-positive bacteria)]MCB1294249.1 MFS transporter [Gordonia sp. (in: high G+C Gram-positive bacteria)]HMS76101.1 MFS transporter [Gordonia sp. (in: high G+C Gram-positive bacteria)]HQV19827.1 MFS transporter [Gordonia sp. (in: high G+C Gram-positive bacteria)]
MRLPGLRRLLAVRLAGQLTDGVFQAGLFGAILFNPERHADPLAIAGGLAVLLLPYSVIGPFAGALIDHWDRRVVLMVANTLRALLIGLVSIAIASGSSDTVVLISALAVTGASRFVSSGMSAGLPHVAPREVIVAVNAMFVTLGAGMLAVGAGIAAGLRAVFGSDNTGSALTELGAVVLALLAAAIARGFHPRQLGPDHADDPGSSVTHAVLVGLWHGLREVLHTPSVAAALSAIGAHRLVFGMNTLVLIIFGRHVSKGDGLEVIAAVGGATALGALLAAITTPLSVQHLGRRATLVTALSAGAVVELSVLTYSLPVIYVAAFLLGLVGQTVKLCGDVAMQCDVRDWVRGQVFSVQDATFNVAYVCAITVAAMTVPDDGHTAVLPVIGSVLYLLGIVAVRVLHPAATPPIRSQLSATGG